LGAEALGLALAGSRLGRAPLGAGRLWRGQQSKAKHDGCTGNKTIHYILLGFAHFLTLEPNLHLIADTRSGWLALEVGKRPQRRDTPRSARLRRDARGRDGGVRLTGPSGHTRLRSQCGYCINGMHDGLRFHHRRPHGIQDHRLFREAEGRRIGELSRPPRRWRALSHAIGEELPKLFKMRFDRGEAVGAPRSGPAADAAGRAWSRRMICRKMWAVRSEIARWRCLKCPHGRLRFLMRQKQSASQLRSESPCWAFRREPCRRISLLHNDQVSNNQD
jgi:hypothetical protein